MHYADFDPGKEQLSSELGAMRATCAVGLNGASLALALLEQSEDCIKLIALDGRLEYMNCGGLHAMEIASSAQVIGKLWWDLWPEESQTMVRRKFQRALSGQPQRFTAECPTALGNPKWWLVQIKPLVAPTGPVASVLCTSREIASAEREHAA